MYNFADSVSHVGTHRERIIFVYLLVQVNVTIYTATTHTSYVCVWVGHDAHFRRHHLSFLEDVITGILEDIYRSAYFIIEKLEVDTQVIFLGYLPVQVVGPDLFFCQSIGTPTTATSKVNQSQIWEPTSTTDLIVTNFTIRSSDLQEIEPSCMILHKFVLSRNPSQGYCREQTELFTRFKVFGTGISHVSFYQISIFIRISGSGR